MKKLILACLLAAVVPARAEQGPYFSIGAAVQAAEGARFVDGADAGHAYLYGEDDLFTTGDFGAAATWRLAAGYRFTPRLRAQVEYGAARWLEYRGTANYPRAGAVQPTTADLRTRQLLAAGFYKIAAWRQIEAYVGAGGGFMDYRLDNFVQQFPDPDNPAGYLQRSPTGEVPLTHLPAGSDRTATGMLTAGVVIPMADHVRLDLGYRYTAAGTVGTPAGGEILVVRYNRGRRVELTIPINETTADIKTQAVLAGLRVEF